MSHNVEISVQKLNMKKISEYFDHPEQLQDSCFKTTLLTNKKIKYNPLKYLS